MGDTQKAASCVGKNVEYRAAPSYGFVRGREPFSSTSRESVPMFRQAAHRAWARRRRQLGEA